ncbi:MAG TPA: hypothetical protein VLL52_03885, partial [Anaerolineae bacterium]|nr:hypothetical protein [Anaerolineae bacterium]
LQTNVPGGNVYENLLTIYHSPDNGLSWQRLNTTLDTQENFAAAQMRGNGLYTLLSTIPYDPFTTGWNNFGYIIPETRPITTELASIMNHYSSIHHRNASNDSWSIYDPAVTTNHPAFAPLVNNLMSFDYTQAYWITVTQPITLFMAPPNDAPTSLTNRSQSLALQFPPATYFGWITPTANIFTPTIGLPVTAWIDGTLCGSTTIIPWQGRLAYNLQVDSIALFGPSNNCGQDGKTVTFQVGSWTMDHNTLWHNDHAWYHPLNTTVCTTPTTVNTFNLTPDNNNLLLTWTTTNADKYAVYHAINDPYFIPPTECLPTLNCTSVTNPTLTQTNALTNPDNNYTFLIVAQNNCGTDAPASEYRGNFQFTIIPGN